MTATYTTVDPLVYPGPTLGDFSAPPAHTITGTVGAVTLNGTSGNLIGRGNFVVGRVFFIGVGAGSAANYGSIG